MLKLPGLIDPHVHLRTPGQSHKEDFLTGTKAALAGGYVAIIDMPNNLQPITTVDRLNEKISLAKEQIVCDVGFHFGSVGDNFDQFPLVQDKVLGLKIYLNQTTGGFIVNEEVFKNICTAWPKKHPILVHAEEDILEKIIEIASESGQKLHVAHVSSQKELEIIINAKQKGYSITCGITPHHLFLSNEDAKKLGPFGLMKPNLKSPDDVNFLWNHLSDIDIVESDHAPHTKEEKENPNMPFGVPGLETTLPLLLTAAADGKITIEDIKRLCHINPARIFGIKIDSQTYLEIDEQEEWILKNENLFTKCKWSPFDGWKFKGKVKRVFIRGGKVFEDDTILSMPGNGKIIS